MNGPCAASSLRVELTTEPRGCCQAVRCHSPSTHVAVIRYGQHPTIPGSHGCGASPCDVGYDEALDREDEHVCRTVVDHTECEHDPLYRAGLCDPHAALIRIWPALLSINTMVVNA